MEEQMGEKEKMVEIFIATGTQEEILLMEKFWVDMKHLVDNWKGFPGLDELGYYYDLSNRYIEMPKSTTQADYEIEMWKVLKVKLEEEYSELPAAIDETNKF